MSANKCYYGEVNLGWSCIEHLKGFNSMYSLP